MPGDQREMSPATPSPQLRMKSLSTPDLVCAEAGTTKINSIANPATRGIDRFIIVPFLLRVMPQKAATIARFNWVVCGLFAAEVRCSFNKSHQRHEPACSLRLTHAVQQRHAGLYDLLDNFIGTQQERFRYRELRAFIRTPTPRRVGGSGTAIVKATYAVSEGAHFLEEAARDSPPTASTGRPPWRSCRPSRRAPWRSDWQLR